MQERGVTARVTLWLTLNPGQDADGLLESWTESGRGVDVLQGLPGVVGFTDTRAVCVLMRTYACWIGFLKYS
jgi:hypothetical protein